MAEQDVVDMTKMINGYLDFCKGEGEGEIAAFNLNELVEKLHKQALLENHPLRSSLNR